MAQIPPQLPEIRMSKQNGGSSITNTMTSTDSARGYVWLDPELDESSCGMCGLTEPTSVLNLMETKWKLGILDFTCCNLASACSSSLTTRIHLDDSPGVVESDVGKMRGRGRKKRKAGAIYGLIPNRTASVSWNAKEVAKVRPIVWLAPESNGLPCCMPLYELLEMRTGYGPTASEPISVEVEPPIDLNKSGLEGSERQRMTPITHLAWLSPSLSPFARGGSKGQLEHFNGSKHGAHDNLTNVARRSQTAIAQILAEFDLSSSLTQRTEVTGIRKSRTQKKKRRDSIYMSRHHGASSTISDTHTRHEESTRRGHQAIAMQRGRKIRGICAVPPLPSRYLLKWDWSGAGIDGHWTGSWLAWSRYERSLRGGTTPMNSVPRNGVAVAALRSEKIQDTNEKGKAKTVSFHRYGSILTRIRTGSSRGSLRPLLARADESMNEEKFGGERQALTCKAARRPKKGSAGTCDGRVGEFLGAEGDKQNTGSRKSLADEADRGSKARYALMLEMRKVDPRHWKLVKNDCESAQSRMPSLSVGVGLSDLGQSAVGLESGQ
ncbi:hypothetical protein C8R47DRAFT_1063018 [Mycena vitilis]|nr:hypothetical protein C8R47DRAFT_1063018 [Mycena vitilis]